MNTIDSNPMVFPWTPEGPPCFLLQDPAIWIGAFDTSRSRRILKKAVKKAGRSGVISIDDDEKIGEICVWMVQSPQRRRRLNQTLRSDFGPGLHDLLWIHSYLENQALRERFPADEIFVNDDKKRAFLNPDAFENKIREVDPRGDLLRSVAIVGCAFAILQPDDRLKILNILLRHDEGLRELLLSGYEEVEKRMEPTIEETGQEDEDGGVHELSREETVSALLETTEEIVIPLKLTRPWLQEGERRITEFLETEKTLSSLAGDLGTSLTDFSLSLPDETSKKCQLAGDMVMKAAAAAGVLDGWIDEWSASLRELVSSCQFKLPEDLDIVDTLFRRPRATSEEMRSVALELSGNLVKLGALFTEQTASLQALVSKINRLEDALEEKREAITEQIPPDDYVSGLRLREKLTARELNLRSQLEAALERRKQACLAGIGQVDSRVLKETPELREEVTIIERCLAEARSPKEIAGCEILLEQLREKVAAITLAPTFEDYTLEAIESGVPPHSVCEIARHLLSRGRYEEAALVLLLLQSTYEPEAVEVDLEDVASLFLESCAGLGSNPEIAANWTSIFFRGPWTQVLTRGDIHETALLDRISLAFVALYHYGSATPHMNQFFELQLHERRLPSDFPVLNHLLDLVVSQENFVVSTQSDRSTLDEKRDAMAAFFRRHENGDYVRQAAHSNEVAEAERDFLFPDLEILCQQITQSCAAGSFEEARKLAVSSEQIAIEAFRKRSLSSTHSPFYKKQIFGQQQGYIHAFQNLAFEYVDTYESWHQENPNPERAVLASDLHSELSRLSGNSPSEKPYWTQVEAQLTQKNPAFVDLNFGTPTLISVLLNCCPSAFARIPDQVATYCTKGPEFSPDSKALLHAVESLSRPIDETTVKTLEQRGCFLHAAQVESLIAKRTGDGDAGQIHGGASERAAQQREVLTRRLRTLLNSGREVDSDKTIAAAIEKGLYGYANLRLKEHENAAQVEHEDRQTGILMQLEQLQNQISAIESDASGSSAHEDWLGRVFDFSSQIEKKIKLGRHAIQGGSPQLPELEKIGAAVKAIRFVVDHNSDSFSELELLLKWSPSSEKSTLEHQAIKDSQAPELEAELKTPWEELSTLKSADGAQSMAIQKTWGSLAREFARISGMYYDLHETLKYVVVPDYQFNRFDTRFYLPRSGWLDKTVSLYLALQVDDWKDRWSRLKTHLDSATDDALKVVIAPNGAEELRTRWNHDPKYDRFVIVDRDTVARISSSKSPGAPLRQILHQSAKKLSYIGLFRTEGWVDSRRNLFVGRDDALEQLSQQPFSAIWGGRRIGKTSLLQALKDRIESKGVIGGVPRIVKYVYADVAGEDPDLDLAQQIATSFDLGVLDSVQTLKFALNQLCEENQVTILVDEVDRYIEASRRVHGETAFPAARVLRGVAQTVTEGRFKLVYAGFKQLYYEVKIRPNSDTADPFKNFLQPVTKDFGDFRPEQVERLLTIAFDEMLGIAFDLDVPRLVKERTSGHPAFIQALGLRLLDRIDRRRDSPSFSKITAKDIEAIYNEQPDSLGDREAYIDYVHETLGLNLSFLERAIMLALSLDIDWNGRSFSHRYSTKEIAQVISEWVKDSPDADCSEFRNALRFLTMTNMLTMRHDGGREQYSIAYPSYIEFMKRMGELNRVEVESSIERYHVTEKGKIL